LSFLLHPLVYYSTMPNNCRLHITGRFIIQRFFNVVRPKE